MKHKREWHTCDRCGVEIKIKPLKEIKFVRLGDYSDIKPYFEDGDMRAKIEETNTFRLFNRKYDLCPKCRKSFEKFMKNDC